MPLPMYVTRPDAAASTGSPGLPSMSMPFERGSAKPAITLPFTGQMNSLPPAEAAERRQILQLMNENGWNQTRVAKKMGIARGTLIERLKRYGIKRPQADD